jgi:hypothetical protein
MKVKLWLILLIGCLYFTCSPGFSMQANRADQTVKKIYVAMDTLFKPAANADGFFVMSSQDLTFLKNQIKVEINSIQLPAPEKISAVNDTISQLPEPIENSDYQLPEEEFSTFQTAEFAQVYLILAAFFLFACLVLFFVYAKNLKKVKESEIRVVDLENEFSNYKSSMIDRERKLMRDLIDARKLEE